jgi:pyruvate-formate lyase-activating enzyme
MSTNVNLPFITADATGPKHLDVTISRAKFNELTADLVEKTVGPMTQAMRDAGVWIELTNLVIPQLTDNLDMIRQMCRWLVDHHLADAPLHFSRFFPRYRLPDTPPTPLSTLRAAQRIALDEGIQHVYLGNV